MTVTLDWWGWQLFDTVTVRVFPSQHSCIGSQTGSPADVCLGDRDVTFQERQTRLKERTAQRTAPQLPEMADVVAHRQACTQSPRAEGGAYAYLIEISEGSILWKDTSGHWTGILGDLRPDVAILAAAGRGKSTVSPFRDPWPSSELQSWPRSIRSWAGAPTLACNINAIELV